MEKIVIENGLGPVLDQGEQPQDSRQKDHYAYHRSCIGTEKNREGWKLFILQVVDNQLGIMRFPALSQDSPFHTLVGAFSLDEALGLQFGQMLLYGFVGNAVDFGQFTGGVFRMGFEQGIPA